MRAGMTKKKYCVSIPDPRSVAACDVSERYARGEASIVDLQAAWAEAMAASWAEARTAEAVAEAEARTAEAVAEFKKKIAEHEPKIAYSWPGGSCMIKA
jgi:hypothetical protein